MNTKNRPRQLLAVRLSPAHVAHIARMRPWGWAALTAIRAAPEDAFLPPGTRPWRYQREIRDRMAVILRMAGLSYPNIAAALGLRPTSHATTIMMVRRAAPKMTWAEWAALWDRFCMAHYGEARPIAEAVNWRTDE